MPSPHLARALRAPLAFKVTAAAAAWAASTAALAQASNAVRTVSLGYVAATVVPPAGAVSAVPGLSMLGLGALTAGLAFMAWRNQKVGRMANKALSISLMVGAGWVAVHGGDSLIQSVRAAGPHEFSASNGGTVSDSNVAFANPASLLTVSNTSGGRIRITSNANSAETGTCTVGSELAPGASCTTQAVCPQPITITGDPKTDCINDPNSWVEIISSDNAALTTINHVTAPFIDPASPPWYTPSSTPVTTAISVAPTNVTPVFDAQGILLNLNERFEVTMTVTAASGYAFDPNGATTVTRTLPSSSACIRPFTPNPNP